MLLSFLMQGMEKTEYCNTASEREVTHITSDSRQAGSKSVFVCIKGFTTDGHSFAGRAYDRGCRAFVAQRELDLPPDAEVFITHDDMRRVLAELSCKLYGEPSKHLRVIGITGTKGKTTTALIIKQLLDAAGIPTGYIGSNGIIWNNQAHQTGNTTPESCVLQYYLKHMVQDGMQAAVIEVSSQALYLDRVHGTNFEVEIFTNLSLDHVGGNEHPTFRDYFEAKKKLFDAFPASLVIANADDEYTYEMLADCKTKKTYYSTLGKGDLNAQGIELCRTESILGMSFCASLGEKKYSFSIPIPGEFNVHNALSAIAVARHFGIEDEKIAAALSSIRIDGRFETVILNNGACFVIDYAHNGLSLTSALLALRKYDPQRLICLFGSVGGRTQIRREQLGKAAAQYADFSILTADNPDSEDPMEIIADIAKHYPDPDAYVAIPDRREAIEYAFEIAEPGDIVLLAGKGHERYQTVNGKNLHFSEREIIEDCINKVNFVS